MQWISVDDSLPPDDVIVLVSLKRGPRRWTRTDFYFKGEWGKYFDAEVTHWMPMPEPAKGGEGNATG